MTKQVWIAALLTGWFCFSAAGQKNVLLEHYTSSWCGECPNAHLMAQGLAEAHFPNLVLAYHHSSVDPMANPHSTQWKNELSIPGTPLGVIDRVPVAGTGPMYAPVNAWADQIESQLNAPDYLDLSISAPPEFGPGPMLPFEVQLKWLLPPPEAEGELRLSVLVVEDSVQSDAPGYQQSNYYHDVEGHPLFGLGGSIENYPFMNVVRDIVGGTWGTANPLPDTPETGQWYSWEGVTEIDGDWDPLQLSLIVVASWHQGGDVKARPVLDVAEVALSDLVVSQFAAPEVHLDFLAFPNPARNILNLSLPEGQYTLGLYNLQGQRILQRTGLPGGAHRLSTAHLPVGAYWLALTHKDGRVARRQLLLH